MKRTLRTILFIFVFLAQPRNLLAQNIAPEIIWQRSYGGSLDDEFRGMLLTADGGFITSGLSGSSDGDVLLNYGKNDYWIVKFDSLGNIQWQKTYGGSNPDWGRNISQTSDGGYLVCGYSRSVDQDVTGNHGDFDFWILRLDALGNLIWEHSYGGSKFDNAYQAIELSDGNYLVVGFTESCDGQVTGFHGGQDYWILKLNPQGSIIWTKTMGGSGKEQASCVIETSDHNYLVAGYAESEDGDVTGHRQLQDMWVVKLSKTGSVVWKKCYGGTQDEGARWMTATNDGNFMICGYSGSSNHDCTNNYGSYDYWVVKIDPSGNLLWQKEYGGSEYEYSYFITPDADQNYLVGGYTYSNDHDVTGSYGSSDYWLIKIDSVGNLMWEKIFGGSLFDECRVVLPEPNGNYLLAGFTHSSDGDVTDSYGGEDGWILEACGSPQVYYKDADMDGYGNPQIFINACAAPSGYVLDNTDCNDNKATQHPGALEICNGIDDDCSGAVDNNVSSPSITASGSTSFCNGSSVQLTATNISNNANYQWSRNGSIINNATSISYTATQTGDYSFTSSFQNCTSSSGTITVTVNAVPFATISNGASVSSCKGENINLLVVQCGGCTYKWNKNGNPIGGATGTSYKYTGNNSANFTVTVTSASGCSATSATTYVTKISKPAANITPLGSLDICNIGQVTLQACSGAGYTYKWLKNGQKITGATNQTYTATTPAAYSVTVTNPGSCSKTSSALSVYSSCRLARDNSSYSYIVSPNPSDGNFSLIIADGENPTVSATVFDITGKKMMTESSVIINGAARINFELPASMHSGIYFLIIYSGDQNRIEKINITR